MSEQNVFQFKSIPVDKCGNPIAVGSVEEVIYPCDGNGNVITETIDDPQELYLPSDQEAKAIFIQVQKTSCTFTDPGTDCIGFGWGSSTNGPFVAWPPFGKMAAIAKKPGEKIGVLRAEAGMKIVLSIIK